ncbi:subtilase-type protease inhibitor [Streptomyces sp. CC224B]|uniref:subtilase-type protease inhibitor n=1 Tax=Streptomyces sp. CC224B TaxID=3044571 RepID=UPI0024A8F2CF|nr:subtilase-type protease inhibitor [Streptomyces sp. CC224B]
MPTPSRILSAAVMAAGILATTHPADAATTQVTEVHAPTALVLSVGSGEHAATATVRRAVTLTCGPRPTGTHPAPRAACTELSSVQGRFDALVDETPGVQCTMEWDPVVVSVTGVREGKHVAWSATFDNPCWKNATLAGSVLLTF